MKTIFIAGTDTGVGKTVICGALASALRLNGLSVEVMKPISCGSLDDIHFLRRCADSKIPLKVAAPIYFKEPLSPNVAAKRAHVRVDLRMIRRAFESIRLKRPDILLVEGCGGLLVPIRKGVYVVDLITRLSAKTVLVSRSGLGAINHTLLSLEALRARRIEPTGVIFNRVTKGSPSIPERTNPDVVADYGRACVLGVFPHVDHDCTPETLSNAVRKHIDLKKIVC